MMSQKHLHELLQEDQEPFFLNNYISNKRTQLKRPSPNTTLQLNKQKQPSPSPTTHFCKNACFLSFHNSPDIRKSPLFEFTSPVKSPKRSSNPIFLHIPAKTASLLLEAALRIQKHSKTKPHNKNNTLFGSFFKRLTQRSRNKKGEIQGEEKTKVSVKDLLGNTKAYYYNGSRGEEEEEENKGSSNGRPSSAVWSDKSLDMETSSSGHSSVEEDAEFVDNKNKQNGDCACFDNHGFFCESPFRFVLQKSPSSSSGRRTPEFTSPAVSPTRHITQDNENNVTDGVNKFQSVEEEEEEKEQCSPVSVLDPPFEYDDDGHENDDEDGRFDLECSYANVQRTKQKLLNRLRRFEQLAELDPVELEKRMQDQEQDTEYSQTFTEDNDDVEDEVQTSCEEKALREIVLEIVSHSSVHDRRQDPEDLKRLVYDLIKEEEGEVDFSEDRNMVLRRVCKRLELWNEVETNTIDMMIEEDLSRDENGRKKNSKETRELACEVEVAIFCYLVEEFSEELVCLSM